MRRLIRPPGERMSRTPTHHETPEENRRAYPLDRGDARYRVARRLYIRNGCLSSARLLSRDHGQAQTAQRPTLTRPLPAGSRRRRQVSKSALLSDIEGKRVKITGRI